MGTVSVALPDDVYVVHDDDVAPVRAEPATGFDGPAFAAGDAVVQFVEAGDGLEVRLTSPTLPVSRAVLRWRTPLPEPALVLGDAWERSYGELQWRHRQPERVLPWYWLSHDPVNGASLGMGVPCETGVVLFLGPRRGGHNTLDRRT